jgi:hypothetical protein
MVQQVWRSIPQRSSPVEEWVGGTSGDCTLITSAAPHKPDDLPRRSEFTLCHKRL